MSEYIEAKAHRLHDAYMANNPDALPWELLTDTQRRDYREQAETIPSDVEELEVERMLEYRHFDDLGDS